MKLSIPSKTGLMVMKKLPVHGAESSYYASLDPPYEAKNAPLDCIEELLMVKGITKEIFNGTKEKPGLAGYVTADSDGRNKYQYGAQDGFTRPFC